MDVPSVLDEVLFNRPCRWSPSHTNSRDLTPAESKSFILRTREQVYHLCFLNVTSEIAGTEGAGDRGSRVPNTDSRSGRGVLACALEWPTAGRSAVLLGPRSGRRQGPWQTGSPRAEPRLRVSARWASLPSTSRETGSAWPGVSLRCPWWVPTAPAELS